MLVMENRWMGMSFAEVVRYHRKRLGLTQERLAEKMGREYHRVSKVEQGQTLRRLPPAEDFREWAEALETTPEQMLTQMGYIEPRQDRDKSPELIFTSLAEEIASAENMPAEVQQTMLAGLQQARRMYELLKANNNHANSNMPSRS
jgi:transcriptional regulator with XRE-family HTH domain